MTGSSGPYYVTVLLASAAVRNATTMVAEVEGCLFSDAPNTPDFAERLSL
jgi:hypothetical protein